MDSLKTEVTKLAGKTIRQANFWRNTGDHTFSLEIFTETEEVFSLRISAQPTLDLMMDAEINTNKEVSVFNHSDISTTEDTRFDL